MLLKGKTAVISGAASKRGIGRATAELFASHGARVAILDINADEAKAAAGDLPPSSKAHISAYAATWPIVPPAHPLQPRC